MRTQQFLIIIFSLTLLSCNQRQENKLEKQFERLIVKKEYVKKIEVQSNAENLNDTIKYYIGYDQNKRVVNNANSEFYEYDSLGRVSKRFSCILDRDPQCNKPYIFFYVYSDGKLSAIKLINSFLRDTIADTIETFQYDKSNRMIKHTKLPTDTFIYSYIGNDTLKDTELWTYWVSTLDSNHTWHRVSRTTTFQYDNIGRKIRSTWVDGNMSMQSDYSFDNRNRVIMQRDTSLDFISREPNSCCILYWTEYKYNNNNKIVEERYSVGMNDKPEPHLIRIIEYEY